jgi:hypothetical protein
VTLTFLRPYKHRSAGVRGILTLTIAVSYLMRLVAGFDPRSGHVEFVVDKVALGQIFSEYFGFPCQFSFHQLLYTHNQSSRVGTIGQLVADVPSGLSLTPKAPNKIKRKI